MRTFNVTLLGLFFVFFLQCGPPNNQPNWAVPKTPGPIGVNPVVDPCEERSGVGFEPTGRIFRIDQSRTYIPNATHFLQIDNTTHYLLVSNWVNLDWVASLGKSFPTDLRPSHIIKTYIWCVELQLCNRSIFIF